MSPRTNQGRCRHPVETTVKAMSRSKRGIDSGSSDRGNKGAGRQPEAWSPFAANKRCCANPIAQREMAFTADYYRPIVTTSYDVDCQPGAFPRNNLNFSVCVFSNPGNFFKELACCSFPW
jgi:hypothetical protein